MVEGTGVTSKSEVLITRSQVERVSTPQGFKDVVTKKARFTAREEELKVEGTKEIDSQGTAFEALQKNIELISQGGGDLESQPLISQEDWKEGKTKGSRTTQTHEKTSFTSGKDTRLEFGKHLNIKGVDREIQGSHPVRAFSLSDLPVHDRVQETSSRKRKKKMGGSKKSTTNTSTQTVNRNTTVVGETFDQKTIKDQELQALEMTVGVQTIFGSEEGKIGITLEESTFQTSTTTKSSSRVYQSEKVEGRQDKTLEMSHIRTPSLEVKAKEGIEVEVKGGESHTHTKGRSGKVKTQEEGTSHTLDEILDDLEQNPDTAWIKALRNNPNVRWKRVEEEHRSWDYRSQGLTPGGAALISLAVCIATEGTSLSLGNFVTKQLIDMGLTTLAPTIGTMMSAGFTTLVSQAAVSLANNKGDIGRTLRELGKEESLRAWVIAVATAGITGGLSEEFGVSQGGMDLGSRILKSSIQTGVSTSLRILSEDLNVREALLQGVRNIVAQTVGGVVSNEIGDRYTNNLIDSPTQKVLHFGLGSFMGFVMNPENPVSGIVSGGMGGMLGAISGDLFLPSVEEVERGVQRGILTQDDLTRTREYVDRTTDLIRLGVGGLTLGFKGNVNTSLLTATNELEHNSIRALLQTLPYLEKKIESVEKGVNKVKEIGETEIEWLSLFKKINEHQMLGLLEGVEEELRDPNLSRFQKQNLMNQKFKILESLGNTQLTVPSTVSEVALDALPLVGSSIGQAGKVLKVFKQGNKSTFLRKIIRPGTPQLKQGPPVIKVTSRPQESPYYSTVFQARLKQDKHFPGKHDRIHFQESNKQLHEIMQQDTQIKQMLESEFPGIGCSIKPTTSGTYPSRPPIEHGLTWHHNTYESGLMELIPRGHHKAPGLVQKNLHPNQKGGMETWGGGRNFKNNDKGQ